jgi:membrane fusion protein (multidrug efflux system)
MERSGRSLYYCGAGCTAGGHAEVLMKKLLFLFTFLACAAAAALAARHFGVDVARLADVGQRMIAAKTGSERPPQAAQQQNRGPLPVETARAASSQLSDDIKAIGTLLAEESVAIAPETSGRVAKILFDDGTPVESGRPLFQFDTELATAALAEAKARLELAEGNYARNQTLRKSGNVAQSTYEAALTEREVARAAVASAQVLLDKLTISAPFAGTLGFRSVSEGAYVTAGTPLVQLDKTDRLKVAFSVPELQQSGVALRQTVDFTADAVPGKTFTGTVAALNPSIDVNGRALQVRADFDNRNMTLRPGLLVRVTVRGPQRTAIVVPEAAIVQRGSTAFVYTVVDDKAKEVKVRIGKRMAGRVEIVEGIAEGDVVVTAGNTGLDDGAAVEVVATAAAAE